jgi:hypothetical protein
MGRASDARTNEGTTGRARPGVIARHDRRFCLRVMLLAVLLLAAAMPARSSAGAQAAPPTLEFDIAREGEESGRR